MSERDEREAEIRLTITPEPTDEETAAIAAVVAALSTAGRSEDAQPAQRTDRWAIAGRHEALRDPLWRGDARATMKDQAS